MPLKPYYGPEDGIVIYHGDCREIAPEIDGYSCVLTDPPYGVDVEVGRLSENGPVRIIGDSNTFVRDWAVGYFQGVPMIMFGSPKVPRPENLRIVLIWDKSELTGMGDLKLPWKLTHEEIYVIGQGFESSFRAGSVLRVPLRPKWTNHSCAVTGEHPTEKPLELMCRLLRCCPLGKVLDPFSGVGPTLQAAKELGREAIGIEIEEKYCEIAAKRLSQKVLRFTETLST